MLGILLHVSLDELILNIYMIWYLTLKLTCVYSKWIRVHRVCIMCSQTHIAQLHIGFVYTTYI